MSLSRAQERAAVILLSASGGRIALGGGGALIAHGLVDRDTDDLDAFVDSNEDFIKVVTRVREAFHNARYDIENITESDPDQLVTWMVRPQRRSTRGRQPEPLKIQLMREPIALDPVPGEYGPLIDPVELGAQKALVIYVDPRPRDYDDLARVASRYRFDKILEVADQREVEPLDRGALAFGFRQIAHMDQREIPAGVGKLRLITYYNRMVEAMLIGDEATAHVVSPYQPEWQDEESVAAPGAPAQSEQASQPGLDALQQRLRGDDGSTPWAD